MNIKVYTKKLLSFYKKIVEKTIYYIFFVDLTILGFFCRGYNFLIFVFLFTYGGYGHTCNDSHLVLLLKFVCLSISLYIIGTSIFLLIVFNIPITRDYLYNLLGKDFVISRIGNPGTPLLKKILASSAGVLGINEGGKAWANYSNIVIADNTLHKQLEGINNTDEDKSRYTKGALNDHSRSSSHRVTEGPIDKMIRAEVVKTAAKETAGTVKTVVSKIATLWRGQ